MLRRPTFRCLRALEASQWLSPAEVQRLQARKLGALLRHAHLHTPFYRRRFRALRLDPLTGDPRAVFAALPTLTKEEIRAGINDMLWHAAPGGLHEMHTGGSCGEPLRFFFDRRRQAYDQAARMRSHRWFQVEVGARELYLWGSPIEHGRTDRVKRVRDWLTNHCLLDAFDMGPRRMDRYLDRLNSFNPACLFGYPSSLALLAEHGTARGRRPRASALRAVFVTGEVCYPHHRETLRDYFGVPVADGYGSREAGYIAHECPQGNLHITAENVFVEVMNEEESLPVGQMGEIVVTHLDAYAMPLIRYRTGDVGRLKAGRCACGRGLPMMDVVQGRATDFLYLPDGGIRHALSIIYPLRAMAGVRQFRVTQHADFSVTVDVVAARSDVPVAPARIARDIQPVLGEGIDVRIELVDRIPTADSGKFRYVVSQARPVLATARKSGDHD